MMVIVIVKVFMHLIPALLVMAMTLIVASQAISGHTMYSLMVQMKTGQPKKPNFFTISSVENVPSKLSHCLSEYVILFLKKLCLLLIYLARKEKRMFLLSTERHKIIHFKYSPPCLIRIPLFVVLPYFLNTDIDTQWRIQDFL